MRLSPLWLSVIFFALAGCGGNDDPPVEPQLFVDRDSIGFGQEYGTGAYVNQQISESLYIENTGQQTLEITEVTKSGASQFTMTLPPELAKGEPMRLEYGKRAFIQVDFKPTQAKKFEGKLLIKSNAANAPEKEIAISGVGYNP
ncbi:Ig-like domain-containing protein [Archangium lipolyticum]|uniref:Ig-like domain-containing protein n=1 Tax=Archangium lipolyticum TaxID=2970465 RepID=UPI002149D77F|nr:hypothetical protein [Archangium lipolyticum]